MGLDLDLATLAGMAGLGGSAIAGLTTAFFFRGLITRIISQIIFTTILSFVGFVALFHALGFQIIPPKQIAGINIPGSSNFSAQSAPVAPVEPGGYVIKSPWSQEKPE
ncbi:MAG: hypothetical protein KBF30_06625 [Hyphomonadaceae bacterium]|nr:hypothetical protein [Hyphomonadaceae bacterium]